MQYRGAHNAPQIRHAPHVSHVLEGSIRRDATRIHLNTQLTDTRTDRHVWAEEYDRDLNDIFAVQSEIAQKVAEQLHVKISPTEKAAIERRPTTDLAAFDFYTRARNLFLAASFSNSGRQDLLEAGNLLKRAIARDPVFFDAYCQLAWTYDLLNILGLDHNGQALDEAEAAVAAASRLRPDAGEAHLARADNLFRGQLDYEGALAELEIARRTLPNDPRVFELNGHILRRQGKPEEGVRELERAIELDPRNVATLQQI